MRARRSVICLSILIIFTLAVKPQDAGVTKVNHKFHIRTGVNVSHWLSQTDRRGEDRARYVTENDFKTIAAMGFDHVRLPVDEVQLWDSLGRKDSEAFALLHHAIQWAMEAQLRTVVDLHIIRSHYFNAASNPLWTEKGEQEKLVNMWHQLSDELVRYPDAWVAYEIMNEAVAPNPEDWNRLLAKVIAAIRSKERQRTIVVGSNQWQIPGTFPALKVPAGDKNIILSFHFYTPLALTHHTAPWTAIAEYTGPVQYPGQIVDTSAYKAMSESAVRYMRDGANGYFTKDTLEKIISPAIIMAKKMHLPLYCGEFGVFPTIPEKLKLRWYRDLCDLMRKNRIAYCHWNYKADFPVVDDRGIPDKKLISILTGK
jgi:endoglucanase